LPHRVSPATGRCCSAVRVRSWWRWSTPHGGRAWARRHATAQGEARSTVVSLPRTERSRSAPMGGADRTATSSSGTAARGAEGRGARATRWAAGCVAREQNHGVRGSTGQRCVPYLVVRRPCPRSRLKQALISRSPGAGPTTCMPGARVQGHGWAPTHVPRSRTDQQPPRPYLRVRNATTARASLSMGQRRHRIRRHASVTGTGRSGPKHARDVRDADCLPGCVCDSVLFRS
jgi:hypothetical protein